MSTQPTTATTDITDTPLRILTDLVADRTAAGIDEADHDDPLAGLVRRARRAIERPRIPSADELFVTREIIVTRLYFPGCPPGWLATRAQRRSSPDLVLGSDGWREWNTDADAMYFTTELEARAAAAATPLPEERERCPAPRFAVILVHDGSLPSDHDLDGVLPEGVTISAAFDPDPGDLGACEGAHRVALDMIRFVGAGGSSYLEDKSARDFGVAPQGGAA